MSLKQTKSIKSQNGTKNVFEIEYFFAALSRKLEYCSYDSPTVSQSRDTLRARLLDIGPKNGTIVFMAYKRKPSDLI